MLEIRVAIGVGTSQQPVEVTPHDASLTTGELFARGIKTIPEKDSLTQTLTTLPFTIASGAAAFFRGVTTPSEKYSSGK